MVKKKSKEREEKKMMKVINAILNRKMAIMKFEPMISCLKNHSSNDLTMLSFMLGFSL